MKHLLFFASCLLLIFSSCKKDKDDDVDPVTAPSAKMQMVIDGDEYNFTAPQFDFYVSDRSCDDGTVEVSNQTMSVFLVFDQGTSQSSLWLDVILPYGYQMTNDVSFPVMTSQEVDCLEEEYAVCNLFTDESSTYPNGQISSGELTVYGYNNSTKRGSMSFAFMGELAPDGSQDLVSILGDIENVVINLD